MPLRTSHSEPVCHDLGGVSIVGIADESPVRARRDTFLFTWVVAHRNSFREDARILGFLFSGVSAKLTSPISEDRESGLGAVESVVASGVCPMPHGGTTRVERSVTHAFVAGSVLNLSIKLGLRSLTPPSDSLR